MTTDLSVTHKRTQTLRNPYSERWQHAHPRVKNTHTDIRNTFTLHLGISRILVSQKNCRILKEYIPVNGCKTSLQNFVSTLFFNARYILFTRFFICLFACLTRTIKNHPLCMHVSENPGNHKESREAPRIFCVVDNEIYSIQVKRRLRMKVKEYHRYPSCRSEVLPSLSLSLTLCRCQDCRVTKLSHRSRQLGESHSRQSRGHTKDKRSHPSPKPTQCELKSKHHLGPHGWLGARNSRLAG